MTRDQLAIGVAERRKQLDIFVNILNDELQKDEYNEDVCIILELSGEFGGRWDLAVQGGIANVSEVDLDNPENYDCKIKTDMKTISEMADGKLKPTMAFLRRKISYSGSYASLKAFQIPFRKAGERWIETIGKQNLGDYLSNMVPGSEAQWISELSFILDSSNPGWAHDESSPRCTVCLTRFTMIRRRHHCRLCGNLVCDYCSTHRLKGNRICSLCFQTKVASARTTNEKPPATMKGKPQVPVEPFMSLANTSPRRLLEAHISNLQGSTISAAIDSRNMPLLEACQNLMRRVRQLESTLRNHGETVSIWRRILTSFVKLLKYSPLMALNLWCWSQVISNLIEYQSALFFSVATSTLLLLSLHRFTFWLSCVVIFTQMYLEHSPVLHVGEFPVDWIVSRVVLFWSSNVWISMPILTAGLFVYTFMRYFGRLVYIYSWAFLVIGLYFATSIVGKRILRFSDTRMSRIYTNLDSVVVPVLCDVILNLRSVFVKFGQYLGSRSDLVPPTWSSILEKLQDDMPTDSPNYVEACIRKEFKEDIDTIFEKFDFQPLASASIAQVHRAVLRPGILTRPNTNALINVPIEVAVKIQHENIEPTMRSDITAFRRIVGVIVMLNSKFEIAVPLFKAWEKEMLRELDFNIEAGNLTSVRSNLRKAGLLCDSDHDYVDMSCTGSQVLVPKPIYPLVSKRAFCMTYLKGFKITDTSLLNLFNVDKSSLVKRIVQAYSCQLFVDGLFNADPHPGNLLVSVSDDGIARPILLDFGMVVSLPERDRIGYSELLYATSQMSISGVTAAIRRVGYRNSQSDIHPERDLEFFAFLLRDTGNRESSRAETAAFRKRRKTQRKQDLVEDPEMTTGRFFTNFPDSLIFLFRVLGLFRGLCTSLDSPISYLEIMGDYAKFSLVRNAMIDNKPSLPSPLPSVSSSGLERALFEVLEETARETRVGTKEGFTLTDLLGCQVCVIRDNRTLADISYGFADELGDRRITPATQFPVMDLSRIPLVILALMMIQENKLGLADRIQMLWPEYPDKNVTIGDLLNYSSRLIDVVPGHSTAIFSLKSLKEAYALVVAPPKPHEALKQPSAYQILTFGLVLGQVLESIFQKDLVKIIQHRIIKYYNLESEIQYQMDAAGEVDVAKLVVGYAALGRELLASRGLSGDDKSQGEDSRAKSETSGSQTVMRGYMEERVGDGEEDWKTLIFVLTTESLTAFKNGEVISSEPLECVKYVDISNVVVVSSSSIGTLLLHLLDGRIEEYRPMKHTDLAMWLRAFRGVLKMKINKKSEGSHNIGFEKPKSKPILDQRERSPSGIFGRSSMPRGFLLDPCCLNAIEIRSALLPSVGMTSTARGLAKLLHNFFQVDLNSEMLSYLLAPKSHETNPLFGDWSWSGGFQVYEVEDVTVFVHHAFGGSIAIVVPELKVTVVITVNCLTLDRTIVKRLVLKIFTQLRISNSVDSMFGGMF